MPAHRKSLDDVLYMVLELREEGRYFNEIADIFSQVADPIHMYSPSNLVDILGVVYAAAENELGLAKHDLSRKRNYLDRITRQGIRKYQRYLTKLKSTGITPDNLPDKVREFMEKMGWSQIDLANRVGVSERTISLLENERLRHLGFRNLAAFYNIIDIMVSEGFVSTKPTFPDKILSINEAISAGFRRVDEIHELTGVSMSSIYQYYHKGYLNEGIDIRKGRGRKPTISERKWKTGVIGANKRTIDYMISEGYQQNEIAAQFSLSRQWINQYIIDSGKHEEWEVARHQHKLAEQNLINTLNIPFQNLVNALVSLSVSKAEQEGIVDVLAKHYKLRHLQSYRELYQKLIAEFIEEPLRRAYDTPLALTDIAHFLPIKETNTLYYPYRKIKEEFGVGRKVKSRLKMSKTNNGFDTLHIKDLSIIYKTEDWGLSLDEICELYIQPRSLVNYALANREIYEPMIVASLRKLKNDNTITQPYL